MSLNHFITRPEMPWEFLSVFDVIQNKADCKTRLQCTQLNPLSDQGHSYTSVLTYSKKNRLVRNVSHISHDCSYFSGQCCSYQIVPRCGHWNSRISETGNTRRLNYFSLEVFLNSICQIWQIVIFRIQSKLGMDT